jgi:protein-S-isoprenylcysteine O-methyltransferase Ste14
MKIDGIKQQWDRALALVAAAVGVVALILGWIGVSGASLVTQQIPYLVSGAVVGLVAFGAASTLWISADLRDEWAKLDDIHRAVTGAPATGRTTAGDPLLVDEPGSVDLRPERATSGGRG